MQNMQEISDEELEMVVGGSKNFGLTSTGVTVTASAAGGYLHVDRVFTTAETISIANSNGESASIAFGFAIALAL